MADELDDVRMAIRKASNEWEQRYVWDVSEKSGAGDKKYVEYLIRVA